MKERRSGLRSTRLPIFFGLLIAPLLPAVAVALLVGFRGPGFDYDTSSVVAFGCIAGGYIAGFCIGWPLLFLWKRRGWTGPIAVGALGAISAACLTLFWVVAFPHRGDTTLLEGFLNLLTFTAPVGAVAGLTFWWVSLRPEAVCRRPLP